MAYCPRFGSILTVLGYRLNATPARPTAIACVYLADMPSGLEGSFDIGPESGRRPF